MVKAVASKDTAPGTVGASDLNMGAVITNVPTPITADATSSAGATVNYGLPTANDDFAGTVPVTCTPESGSTFGLGTTIVNCTASDNAQNTMSVSFNVNVVYSWSGVLQPINGDGTSVFKLGSTVPIKFQLTGASAGIQDAVARLFVAKLSNGVTGSELEATSNVTATSGNQFRYDASNAQYVFNWGTNGLSAGTYQLRIDLGDGVIRTVTVSLKK